MKLLLFILLYLGFVHTQYFLLVRLQEELNNAELAILQAKKWCDANNITLVEPFVCDSHVGGLPGWTFPPGDLFWRNTNCTLKPWSWYKRFHEKPILRSIIPYEDFVSRSTICDNSNPPSNVSAQVGDGLCAQICLLVLNAWNPGKGKCHIDYLKKSNLFKLEDDEEEKKGYGVIDPFTKAPTNLFFRSVRCFEPDQIEFAKIAKLADNMFKDGKCKTNSFAVYDVGKGGLRDFRINLDGSNANWGLIETEINTVPASDFLKDTTHKIKDDLFGGDPYIAVQLRIGKLTGGDISLIDAEMQRKKLIGCLYNAIDTVVNFMNEHNMRNIYLMADYLVRNSTTELGDSLEALSREIFDKVIMNSGIPWVYLKEGDKYSSWYDYDRGAWGIIDQQMAIEADHLFSFGSGSFSRRILNNRRIDGTQTTVLTCSDHVMEEIPNQDWAKEKLKQTKIQEKQTDKQEEKQTDKQEEKQTDKQEEKQTNKQEEKQTNKQEEKQTNKQEEKQTDKQENKQGVDKKQQEKREDYHDAQKRQATKQTMSDLLLLSMVCVIVIMFIGSRYKLN